MSAASCPSTVYHWKAEAGGGPPAPGQDAVRGPHPAEAPGPPHPPPLAAHPDRLPGRQPLRPSAGHGLARRRLHLRPRGQSRACRSRTRYDLKVRRAKAGADKMRSFAAFAYAARSWSRKRRVVARLEASSLRRPLCRQTQRRASPSLDIADWGRSWLHIWLLSPPLAMLDRTYKPGTGIRR